LSPADILFMDIMTELTGCKFVDVTPTNKWGDDNA